MNGLQNSINPLEVCTSMIFKFYDTFPLLLTVLINTGMNCYHLQNTDTNNSSYVK